MELEKQKQAKRKGKGGKGGPVWRGGPGALARLNFKIEGKQKEEVPAKAGLKQIDVMIHRADQREQEGSGGRLSGGDTSTRGGRASAGAASAAAAVGAEGE